jgi:hypothetical protein
MTGQLVLPFHCGCNHVVREEFFQTVEGCWSPYSVVICTICGEVTRWPCINFLAVWPVLSIGRLVLFVEK